MDENLSPSWTPGEKEQLHHVDFITEVLRRSATRKTPDPPKPRWQRFLESTGGAALITVLIGGIAGGIITGLFQYWQKGRDTQQAILKTRTEQALLAYKEYLDKRQEVNKTTYEMLAACISASDNLMDAFTRSDFDPQGRTGQSLQEAKKIQDDAKKAYVEATARWQSQVELTGLLLAQYHDNNPEVATKWDGVKSSIDAYIKCAETCFLAGKSGCGCRESVKAQLRGNLGGFQTAVAKSRDFFWKQNLCGNNYNEPCQP
jgi:gas vesicle protein